MNTDLDVDAILQRSKKRRARMVTHRASGFADADRWDLLYWQKQGSDARLSALVAILEDVEKTEYARRGD